MLANKASNSILARIYTAFLISAIASGIVILYSMSLLYVHTFFGLAYIILFFLGFFLGNICFSLFSWERTSKIVFITSIFILFIASFFLFPFAHDHYSSYSLVRVVLLIFIISIGVGVFILLKKFELYSKVKQPLEVYILLFISIITLLFLQTYVQFPFSGFLLSLGLFIVSLILISQKVLQTISFIVLLVICSLGFIFFQKMDLFFISTPKENKTRLFEQGTQIDFKVPQATNNSILDISDLYQGNFPTLESIYTNGRYYGRLVGDLNQINYAEQTPYNVLYSLKESPKVLILDSAGGAEVFLTHTLISGEIDALEKNQEVLNQIRDKESLYVGGIYHNRNTLFYRSSIRPYIATTDKTYDILTLNYNILDSNQMLFLSEEEQKLSIKAIQDYFNILNPQGFLFVNIKTFNKEFNQILALKIINTMKSAIRIPGEELFKRVHIFETPYSLNLILSKREFLEDKEAFYNKTVETLGYTNIVPKDTSSFLYQGIQAILQNNKNQIAQIHFNIDPIRDDWNNWFFQMASRLNLWEHNPADFSLYFMQYFLLIIAVIAVIATLFSQNHFKKTNLYKMGLGNFFPYFLCFGVAFGFSIVFGLDFFNYLLSSDFIFGSWALTAILLSRFLGVLIFNMIGKVYLKIRIAILAQIIIDIVLLCVLNPLRDYLIALPLVFKILLPIALMSLVYVFLFIPVLSGFLWVNYMQAKDASSLRASLILGTVFGLSFGSYFLFYYPAFWILGASIALLIIGYFFSIFLDKKSKEIDYLYAKERI